MLKLAAVDKEYNGLVGPHSSTKYANDICKRSIYFCMDNDIYIGKIDFIHREIYERIDKSSSNIRYIETLCSIMLKELEILEQIKKNRCEGL